MLPTTDVIVNVNWKLKPYTNLKWHFRVASVADNTVWKQMQAKTKHRSRIRCLRDRVWPVHEGAMSTEALHPTKQKRTFLKKSLITIHIITVFH